MTAQLTATLNVTLSNGNLTATASGAPARAYGNTTVVGKRHFEWNADAIAVFNGWGITNSVANGWIGDTNATGVSSDGAIYGQGNFYAAAKGSAVAANDKIICEIDTLVSPAKAWFAVGSGDWNGSPTANPATNTGGIDVSAVLAGGTGILYVASLMGGVGDASTVNHGLTTFARTPSSGFTGLDQPAAGAAAGVGTAAATGAPRTAAAGSAAGVGTASGTTPIISLSKLLATFQVSLTNSDLTATATGAPGRSLGDTAITGKKHFEWTAGAIIVWNGWGIANTAGAGWIGAADATGVSSDGGLYGNGAFLGGIKGSPIVGGDVTAVEVDTTVSPPRGWFSVNGGLWNASSTANPATNTGGIDITDVATGGTNVIYVATMMGGTGDSSTINYGRLPFNRTPSSGFTAVDALAATPAVGVASGAGTAASTSGALTAASVGTATGTGSAAGVGASNRAAAGATSATSTAVGGIGSVVYAQLVNVINTALTNNNLTATSTAAAAAQARGDTAISGKKHFEWTIGAVNAFVGCGIGNTAQGGWIGANDAMGVSADGAIYGNGAYLAAAKGSPLVPGDIVICEIDTGVSPPRGWFAVNGGYYNNNAGANPATNTGGFDISDVATGGTNIIYPYTMMGGLGDSATINHGASTFNRAPSSGFSAVQPIASGPSPTTLDRSILGAKSLDVVFFRDGFNRRVSGGLWNTRFWYDYQNNDPNLTGYLNRITYGDGEAIWTDATMQPEVDPFSVQSNGLHIKVDNWAPYKANWWPSIAAVQAKLHYAGTIMSAHSQGSAFDEYRAGDWLAAWGPGPPVRNEALPHWERKIGFYVEIKISLNIVTGVWPASVLYTYGNGGRLYEIDIYEWFSAGLLMSIHRWGDGPEIHDSLVPNPADGGTVPTTNLTTPVVFGLLYTADQKLRWYMNDRLMRTRDVTGLGFGVDSMYLQVHSGSRNGNWVGAGPLSNSDLPNDSILEYVYAYDLTTSSAVSSAVGTASGVGSTSATGRSTSATIGQASAIGTASAVASAAGVVTAVGVASGTATVRSTGAAIGLLPADTLIDIAQLDIDNNAVCGVYIDDESTTFKDAMDFVAASVGAYYAFDQSAVFRMGRLTPPEPALEADISITREDILGDDLESITDRDGGIPIYSVTVFYRKNNTTQTAFAGSVTPDIREDLAKDYLPATKTNMAVRNKYKLAGVLIVYTALINLADALEEAQRLLDMFDEPRKVYEVPLHSAKVSEKSLRFMKQAELTINRFGMDNGKTFRITGLTFELSDKETILTVWG